jgi:hypothetical protein
MNRFGRVCLLASAATLAVAGCGSVSGTTGAARTSRLAGPAAGATAGPAASATAGLCAAVAEMDTLTVSRDEPWPVHRFRSSRRPVVSPAQQARAVARAVCALPRMPRGAVACPADWGVSYQLRFAASGRRFGVVSVQPGGCRRVSGAGPPRWAVQSPGFWSALDRAAAVPWSGTGLNGCGGMSSMMCASGSASSG